MNFGGKLREQDQRPNTGNGGERYALGDKGEERTEVSLDNRDLTAFRLRAGYCFLPFTVAAPGSDGEDASTRRTSRVLLRRTVEPFFYPARRSAETYPERPI